VVSIHLEHKDQIWKVPCTMRACAKGQISTSPYASMPNHELQTKFPRLCKAGSFEDVSDVVNVALSGMVIKPLTHVPAAIPLRLENQYFSLDLSSEAARAMLEAGSCTFYTPRSLGDVKLELFAVLRT
jgi:type VI secretion system protein ImpJ